MVIPDHNYTSVTLDDIYNERGYELAFEFRPPPRYDPLRDLSETEIYEAETDSGIS